MKANYKKLWHILLDRDMKKKELAQIAGVSTYTINKLNKNENVTVEVLDKICRALNCLWNLNRMKNRRKGYIIERINYGSKSV